MEQNLVSDEELIERINKVLKESKQDEKPETVEVRQEDAIDEKFHDVYETAEQAKEDSEVKLFGAQKNLVLENHYLSLQLQAEKKKSKELQSKFKLFENSVKYFERLNGQLETIKRAVDEEYVDTEDAKAFSSEAMQKIRPKTIHTASNGMSATADEASNAVTNFSEPRSEDTNLNKVIKLDKDKEEVAFRDADDFRELEQGLEIVKDKHVELDSETEKVFITKTEKRCLEDIGNIASRTRAPLDDKHQRFFERDRRRFANSIVMPEVQEVQKTETVPPEIISKTKETPVNITSTELDGLRSYLLQLKELIARRETAWARTTERDYNQRVEITRFKNEVSHLRMLCEKRQRDLKEKDQVIASKDEEIRELQKRIQGLRNAIMKLEKKDDHIMDKLDGIANEVLENSQIVQRSYNAMKRQSLINRANTTSNVNVSSKIPANVTTSKPVSRSKDLAIKKSKVIAEKSPSRRVKLSESTSNDEEIKTDRSKPKGRDKLKSRHRSESTVTKNKDTMDEKLQRVEEMLHDEVLRGSRKSLPHGRKNSIDLKTLMKNPTAEKFPVDFPLKKTTPSNSIIRQEMLTALTGLNTNNNLGLKSASFPDPKKNNVTAAVIANALLAARNSNLFNYQ